MTLKETLVVVAGMMMSFALVIGFVVFLIRRSMDKPPKKTDRDGDHYYESGLGDDPGSHH